MAISATVVREMVAEVVEFTRAYAVWRGLMEPSNRDVRQHHPDFLLTVTNCMVQGFCVGTFLLFDRDSRTKSLWRLIEELRLSDPTLAQGLARSIDGRRPELEKVFSVRH